MDDPEAPALSAPFTEGEWAGWSTWTGSEPFEEFVGPYYARREADGRMITGCRAQPKTLNGAGTVHGGALMSFADYSLFLIAYDELRGLASVTVSLQGEFLAAPKLGDRLIGRGEITKAGRSLLFIRGLVFAEDAPVLNFSGVIKIIRPRPAG